MSRMSVRRSGRGGALGPSSVVAPCCCTVLRFGVVGFVHRFGRLQAPKASVLPPGRLSRARRAPGDAQLTA